MKLKDYLKDVLGYGYDNWNDYEVGVHSFISALVDVVSDNIECDLDSLPNDDILSEWSEESGIDNDTLEFWMSRGCDEYYPGDNDCSTGSRHVAEMMMFAIRKYQERHNGELLVNAKGFVEGVLECFVDIDAEQESLYDEVADICSNLWLDPDDFYDYFDIYGTRAGETYDEVDVELIEKLASTN